MTPDQFVILAKCEAGLNNQMQSVHKFIKQGKHTKRMVDLKEYNKKVKKKTILKRIDTNLPVRPNCN